MDKILIGLYKENPVLSLKNCKSTKFLSRPYIVDLQYLYLTAPLVNSFSQGHEIEMVP